MSINLETEEVSDFMESRRQILSDKFGDRAQAASAMVQLLIFSNSYISLQRRLVEARPEQLLNVPRAIEANARVLSAVSTAFGFDIDDTVYLTDYAKALMADLRVVAEETESV